MFWYARGGVSSRTQRLALVVSLLVAGGCAGPRESNTEPPRRKQLEQTCSADDNPLRGRAPNIALSVPVTIDPALEVPTRWAASGYIRDDELIWDRVRLVPEKGRFRSSALIMELAHHKDGSLDVTLYPQAGPYSGLWASAKIVQSAGELQAELRSGSYSDVVDKRGPWRESELLGGELRLSSASWVAGDELGIFLEVVLERGRHCGELRFVVPEPGQETSIHCEDSKCISS
jgi:hypothetical protein